MIKILVSVACLFSLLPGQVPARRQQQTPSTASQSASPAPPASQSADDDEVVRITTNLVQIDAVVVDKDGRHVSGLTPEDFEIYEDDRRREITNFSYVAADEAEFNGPAPTRGKVPPPAAAAPAAAPLRPEQVQRTIAVVVDDLTMSFESVAYVREALKRFVAEQLRPGDLVAITRTSSGVGALQQFTADRRQLFAAAESIRWGARRGGIVDAFAPLTSRIDSVIPPGDFGGLYRADSANGLDEAAREDFFSDLLAVGTLGSVNFSVRGMRELPGRKSILLVSDGFPLSRPGGESFRVTDAMRRLTDSANRASVVIYTMDARGLPVLGLTAADEVSRFRQTPVGAYPDQLTSTLAARRQQYRQSQEVLHYLAQQTGGFFVRNNNDLAGGIRRIVADQRGYYLIGYRPEADTFRLVNGKRNFHRLSVRVKRPGLSVRTRTGFFGVTDEEAVPIARTKEQQIYAALSSPFGASEIDVRLTPLFANDAQAGSFMRALLHIDAEKLTFTEEADGWHKAVIDVAAVTAGASGDAIDQANGAHTIRMRGETYNDALKHGVVYTLLVPVKQAGAYQLRMAVRDAASGRVGSASQFIEVPDFEKKRLALSGMILHGEEPSAAAKATDDAVTINASAIKDDSSRAADAHPAVRQLRPGATLGYNLMIYNAQLDRATARPQLRSQVRMFRDNQLTFAGKEEAVKLTEQLSDPRRIYVGGVLRLGANMPAGRYALQLVVTDELAKDKKRATVAQWMDFEVTN